jgi:hypothetical protein
MQVISDEGHTRDNKVNQGFGRLVIDGNIDIGGITEGYWIDDKFTGYGRKIDFSGDWFEGNW